MTTQVQATHSEQVFADIFSDENLTKYNKIDDTKTSSETVDAINSFLDSLEAQYPDYIFVDSPNLERDKKIKIGVLVNAFDRTKTEQKIERRYGIRGVWLLDLTLISLSTLIEK